MYNLVSVIMPAYNVAEYIGASIESVINQTYLNWELIVINDGSTDDTLNRTKKWAEKDPRIRFYSQENGGVSRARNKGLSLAKGDYVAFLDADDLWKPEFLEKLLHAKNDAALVYCGYERLFTNGKYEQRKNNFANGQILLEFLQCSSHVWIGSFIVTKKLLDEHEISFTDGCRFSEDFEFITKILTVTQCNSTPEYLAIYRQRPGSAMESKLPVDFIHNIRARIRIFNYIQNHYTNINEINVSLHQWFDTEIIKFLWKMLKYGCYKDVMASIDNEVENKLKQINQTTLKRKDRSRYRIIMLKNIILWKIIMTFKNLINPSAAS